MRATCQQHALQAATLPQLERQAKFAGGLRQLTRYWSTKLGAGFDVPLKRLASKKVHPQVQRAATEFRSLKAAGRPGSSRASE